MQAESKQLEPALKKCPACAEQILVEAKKCKHCGECVDFMASAVEKINNPKPVAIVVKSEASPGVAAVLALWPGLGHLYRGQLFSALAWFVFISIGYVCLFVPGILLHLLSIYSAYRNK